MTDLKTLKQLVKLMVDHDLTEIDLAGEGEKIKISRAGVAVAPQVSYAVPAVAPAAPQAAAAPAAAAAAPAPAEEKGATIDSPMVGTFYTAASPDAAAFAKVGDRVTPDTVVCIIEAMKVFNEIKAETSGVISKVLVSNGQAVEYGQGLFQIQPG